MSRQLVSDEMWRAVEPLLPKEPPKPKGGRPRVSDRACLTGIIFVLKTGLPWNLLPAELGWGSGPTCWRRLVAWQQAGVWERLHRLLLDWLGDADQIDWSRASLDAASVPAKRRPQSTLSASGIADRRDSARSGSAGRGTRGQPDPCPQRAGLVS